MNQSGLSSIERSALIALYRLTQVVEPDQWHSRGEVAAAAGVDEHAAEAILNTLRDRGLSMHSGRVSGGWRTSTRGDELAHRSIESMTSGRDRQEHTMREILRLGGDRPFGPGEWQSWDLHADGAPVVAEDERIRALAALERLGCLTARHSWQQDYFRCEVTPLGVDVLSRPDISLADRALGQGQPAAVTNIDQRVGVLAHTVTNHGALQVGDNNTQTVTLTAEQSSRLLSQLSELRELISAVNVPHEVSDRLESDIHELEQVAAHGGGVGRARVLLGDMVQASAVAASTDAGQRLGQFLFSLMGGLV